MEKHPVLADLKSDRIEKKHLQCYKLGDYKSLTQNGRIANPSEQRRGSGKGALTPPKGGRGAWRLGGGFSSLVEAWRVLSDKKIPQFFEGIEILRTFVQQNE